MSKETTCGRKADLTELGIKIPFLTEPHGKLFRHGLKTLGRKQLHKGFVGHKLPHRCREQGQALTESSLLLATLALRAKDDARAVEAFKVLGERIKKE